ncbi:helix-turn-helix transcriptional regulator [Pelobacter propionicus]|uniref:helix-turn-helix transcriptional regulator n=1 Tax=Pelobacter propionicus TaxID=29543 RepID=UPI0005A0B9D6
MTEDRIINKRERRELTNISEPTWWRYERAGLVPRRVQLTRGRVGYRLREILAWLESRQPA